MDHLEPLEDYELPPANRGPMAKVFALVVVALIAVILFRSFVQNPSAAKDGWHKDWDTAVQLSKTSGKPALVLFTADWCPACQTLESQTLADPDVAQYLKDNYTLVMVDLSDRSGPNNARAHDFGVSAIPTLILYDARGLEKTRSFGMSSSAMLSWLKSGGTAITAAQ